MSDFPIRKRTSRSSIGSTHLVRIRNDRNAVITSRNQSPCVNPELIDRVPAEAIERVAATKSAIREGEVDLPRVIVVEGEVEGR